MKKILITASVLVMAVIFWSARTLAIDPTPTKDGPTIFAEAKCDHCHSVTSAGITSNKRNAVDLSNCGANTTAESIELYITKRSELNGKKHKDAFRGSAEDLQALAAWLATLIQ